MTKQRERTCPASLEALRNDIRAGLASGPAEPLDMSAIKAEARARRVTKNSATT